MSRRWPGAHNEGPLGRSVCLSRASGMHGTIEKIFGGGVGGSNKSSSGHDSGPEHATTGRIGAHVVDAIGGEPLKPETAAGGTSKS